MSALTAQKLKEMLIDAYVSGYRGCMELAEDYALETITKLVSSTPPVSNWKLWQIAELRAMPVGTVFEHKERGKGFIKLANNPGAPPGSGKGVKYMEWENGTHSMFGTAGNPWDKPMRVIGNATPVEEI